MKELKFNLKLLTHKKEFYFAILIICLVNIIHCFMTIQYDSNLGFYIENTYSAEYQFILRNYRVAFSSIVVIVFPIVCTMLLSDLDYYEKQHKIANLLSLRVKKRKNNFIRLFLSFIIPFGICFLGFMLNYGIMRIVFKSGTLVSDVQSVAFYQNIYAEWFLDSLRYHNIVAYTLSISLITSVAIGVLSSLSYSLSIFLRKKVLIYCIPLFIIILSEMIFPLIHLKQLSIMRMLNPDTQFTVYNAIITILIFITLEFIITWINNQRKDSIL